MVLVASAVNLHEVVEARDEVHFLLQLAKRRAPLGLALFGATCGPVPRSVTPTGAYSSEKQDFGRVLAREEHVGDDDCHTATLVEQRSARDPSIWRASDRQRDRPTGGSSTSGAGARSQASSWVQRCPRAVARKGR